MVDEETKQSPSADAIAKVLEETRQLREAQKKLEFELFANRQASAMWIAENIIYGEQPSIALMSTDGGGRILYMNGRAQALFGYEDWEMRGKLVEILIPVQLRDIHVRYREEYVKNPGPRTMGQAIHKDLHGLTKSGIEIPLIITLWPTRREGNLVVNLQCAVRE